MTGNILLSNLKVKESAKIKQIIGAGSLKRKFLDMGIIAGTPVEVVKVAPFGDPIDIKIKGYHLSLRKEEANLIVIERVNA